MNPSFFVHCRRAFRVCLWFVLCGFVSPAASHAYELEGPRWPSNQPVVMYVQLSGPAQTLTDGSKSWNEVAESALSIWNPCLGSGVQFSVATATTTNVQGDHKNSVFSSISAYGTSFGDDTLAITLYTFTNAGAQFTETDVIVNKHYAFDSYRGPVGTRTVPDLRRVLVHEFGHVLGLDHTADSAVAVMTPFVGDIDTIEADDIAGVESIYGAVGGARPVITSSLNFASAADRTFQYQIKASNTPISYYATGMPSGFVLNTSTGVITGTAPYNPTTVNVTLTANNAAGSTTATLVLNFFGAPEITSPNRIGVQPGKPFTYQITATNSPTSYAAFDNFNNPLPAGVTVNPATGLVSGIVPNGFQFLGVQATNAAGSGFELVIVDTTYVPPAITGVNNLDQLAPGGYTYTGAPCLFQVNATGQWSNFTASGLPAGMYVNSLGVIMGTPTTPGAYTVTLTVAGAYSSDTYTWNLQVGGQPIVLTSGTITGLAHAPLTYQITGTPKPTGFQFAFSFGHDGLSLDPATGIISGTPPSANTGTVAVFLSNGADGALVNIPFNFAPGDVSSFFVGESPVDNAYYLVMPNGSPFGFYAYLSDPHYIYHFDMGYEYIFDANDGNRGAYFYDFKSGGFFYTSQNFAFPYLYDFNLNSVVFYYPDPSMWAHYNTNGIRYFYVFNTGQIISK